MSALRIVLLACLFAPNGVSQAQHNPARLPLRASDAALAEEFNRLISLRELADGRVLLSDNRDNRIVVADFALNKVTQVGSIGSGPGEYRRAGLLLALSADSTLLADAGNGRWLLMKGSAIVRTVPQDDRAILQAPIPAGADESGHILGHRVLVRPGGGVDSTPIALVSRQSGRADTVTKLATMPIRVGAPVKLPDSRITVQRVAVSSWATGEQAILFRDGWIAIARLEPYRVEWFDPSRTRHRGPSLPFVQREFDDREKRFQMQRAARSSGALVQPAESRTDWPDMIQPFSSVSSVLGQPSPALLGSPDGMLLIARAPTANEPETRYDVVGRDGFLKGQIVLTDSERFLGFGLRHAYVVVTDADGVERVRRHPWP